MSLAASTMNERSTIKANWEDSSDKYARIIASRLEKLGLIEKVPKKVTVIFADKISDFIIPLSQSLTKSDLAETKEFVFELSKK